jgi:mono/diheme cytochrome c family protein
MNRYPQALCLSLALALAGAGAGFAQNLENGRRLSERWCVECHAIDAAVDKPARAPSFAAIAARESVTPEMIASFLRMPHATMPNLPLTGSDARDIAALIMGMRK